jgi:hypothetical protein
MEDIELLQCLIETEINKQRYKLRIAKEKGQDNRIKAITNFMSGLKQSLIFIREIQDMEE